jgi:hypothetical protein
VDQITFVCFKWGSKYPGHYVSRLASGIVRNYVGPHRFICFADNRNGIPGWIDVKPIEDRYLLPIDDGCYVRVRMFDPKWQERYNITRLVSLDLDLIITGGLNPLFDRSESFMILGGGHFNPCPYNGSVMMIEAGAARQVWDDFYLIRACEVARADGRYRGTDQTWIAHCVPDAATWTYRDGIFSFRKPGWPTNSLLKPEGARIVSFPGNADPLQYTHLPWVQEAWR